jgi:hypothetical protein
LLGDVVLSPSQMREYYKEEDAQTLVNNYFNTAGADISIMSNQQELCMDD